MNDADKTNDQLMRELAGLRQRVAELEPLEAEHKRFDVRLVKMNECFLGFGTDPDENINRLTALCGELLGGTCALYGRLEQGLLCSLGQWHTPPDFNPVDHPEGHICYDVIRRVESRLWVVRNLSQTSYAQTDPNVKRYNLQTYIGQAVKCGGTSVGSLCVVYQKDFVPDESDKRLMRILATAVGVEEERKKAEKVLLESEARFRAVVESLGEGLIITDADDVVLDMNARMTELTGYAQEELMGGRPAYELLLPPREWPVLLQRNKQRIRGVAEHYEVELTRKDGSLFWADVHATPYRNTSGEAVGTLGAITDITERKRMEQKMVHLERMRALGEMAQGVAHNFNNILAIVLGYSELIQTRLRDPENATDMEELVAGVLRASDLVRRLNRAVTNEEETTLHPVLINHVAQEAVEITRPQWKDEPEARGLSINVLTELEEVPPIRGTQSGLHDIFINLLFNAVDAMPRGGTITIRTQTVAGDVQLTVTDSGVGMSGEIRRRVFEPFFTTKMTVGTGLGLSTVYGTMTRWGGQIEVESAPDQGTTFTLRFPTWPDLQMQEAEGPAEICPEGRRGKILIVEDDESICGVLSQLLARDHEVETVLSGLEALEQFAPGCCDVALIDLGMPETPGDQVAREIKQADPSVATVLITGWVLKEDDPRLSAFDFRLEKPVRGLKIKDVVAQAVKLHDARAGTAL